MTDKTQTMLGRNQSGLVSFVVTLIIMIILSLIVIGFSQLSRREQRQSLDNQLQTQAFYAAESGINKAISMLEDNPALPARTDCNDANVAWSALTANSTLDDGVQYTCVLVNPTPPDIVFDEVGTDSKVTPLNSGDGSAFTRFTLRWQNSESSVPADINDCDTNASPVDGRFPAINQWGCSVGLLRVDLVPTPATGFDREALLSNMMTAFFYPSTSGSDLVFGTAINTGQGAIVNSACSGSPLVCEASIDVSGRTDAQYMMRIRSVYRNSQLTITSLGKTFRDVQAVVDATGRAQDVLRRLQVRKPIGTITNPLLADYTIESNDICKRYTFIPGASGSVGTADCPIN